MSLFNKLLATDIPIENKTLPSGYTQLEYIQSSGTQYINTGITAENYPIDINIDFVYTEATAYGNIVTAQGAGSQTRILRLNNTGANFQWFSGGMDHNLGSVTVGSNYHADIHYESGASYITLNGTKTTDSSTLAGFTKSFYLFAGGSAGGSYFGSAKIYNCKFTVNGIVVRNFIPAKNSSNVLGMYDLVTNTFFTNAGTGTFIAGAEVKTLQINKVSYDNNLYDYTLKGNTSQQLLPSGYTQLEYLETDGNSCINTNLMITGNESWECMFQNAGSSNLSTPVLGTLNGGSHFTNVNNFSITYTTAKIPGAYAVYLDGNNGNAQHSWNGGVLTDHTIQTIKYTGLNIAPTINDVAMAQLSPTTLVAITPSVGVRLFGRATTAGNGTLSQAGVRIYSFKGDSWNFIPAKRNSDNVLGMYDLVSNTFFTNAGTGTFTAGNVTPTPSTPIEVASVGDKTENLFNKNSAIQGDINSTTGNVDDGATYRFVSDFIPCENGKTYTISGKVEDTTITRLIYALYGANKTFISGSRTYVNATSFTINNADAKYVRVESFRTTGEGEPVLIPQHLETVQIEEGTTATSYQPYGYKVPISTKNALGTTFTGNTFVFNDTLDNTVIANWAELTVNFKNGNDETCTGMRMYTSGGNIVLQINSGNWTTAYNNPTGWADNKWKTLKFTGEPTSASSATVQDFITWLNARGHLEQTTNIYLTKPLPKLGNKQDSINYKNQTLTMGTSYYEFTGNETFTSTYSTQFGYVFTCANILSGVQTSATASDMLCTHFRNSGASTDIKFSFTSGTNLNFAVQTTWTSTSDFKAWLTAQKTAGTPVTVYYPLQDDVTISVTTPTGGVALPAIPVKSGSNTLEVNTSVTLSEVDATAWCWRF